MFPKDGPDASWKVFLESDGTLELGARGATEHAIFGDAFKTEYDAHAHPTPFGPTGGPIVALPPACLSTLVKIG